VKLSANQRIDLWSRWKTGHSLPEIGRAFCKSHVYIHFMLSHHGRIVSAVRQRSLLTLTLAVSTALKVMSYTICTNWKEAPP